jgi:hypothetical protein
MKAFAKQLSKEFAALYQDLLAEKGAKDKAKALAEGWELRADHKPYVRLYDDAIDELFDKYGLRRVGSGCFKSVYSSDSCPFVFRVGSYRDAYQKAPKRKFFNELKDTSRFGTIKDNFLYPRFYRDIDKENQIFLDVVLKGDMKKPFESGYIDTFFADKGCKSNDLSRGNCTWLEKASRWMIIDY